MRAVLDTNILVSALIAPVGNPAAVYNAWEQGKFTLITCAEHVDELRATLQNRKSPISLNLTEPAAWSTKSRNSPRTSASCRG